ncbi:aryl-hydrocarbon-interacting protein-like 1 [Oncorhynchus clarkii lewisi]|uniref:aryl-hydrocarbon-interacting protein-like 1 n=1 Tax=Oncorhynchus clarkii lewisi TaxID=490388 RepID=UPI0039B94C7F
MFKMEVWEKLLTSMRIGEVAEFWCDAVQHVIEGGAVAIPSSDAASQDALNGAAVELFEDLRAHAKPFHLSKGEKALLCLLHDCASMGDPFSYKRDLWILDKDEKMKEFSTFPGISTVLPSMIVSIILKEWTIKGGGRTGTLEKVRVPNTLNLSPCLLELREYQEVVALNTKLLKKHTYIFKAVYQRARAHLALCNEQEARKHFRMLERLEPRFKPIVNQENKRMVKNLWNKHVSNKKNYWETRGKVGP